MFMYGLVSRLNSNRTEKKGVDMRLIICDKETDLVQIKQKDYKDILKERVNVLVLGKSGLGKTKIALQYAKDNELKVKLINLASKLPEAIGGIPHATDDKKYYTELLHEELREVFDEDGENWLIIFDEINQASPEVLNTLYGICYPMGEDRAWAGHSLSKAQILATGNLNDGSDGTVYLTDLPTPLLNRFFVYELVSDRKDVMDYLKEKWKNVPHVAKYISILLDNGIPPRDIELCLDVLAYEKNGLLLQSKLGPALTQKLFDVKHKIATVDPAKAFKICKENYALFKENGYATWASEMIEEEEDLLDKFREVLSEEEVMAIVKGGE